MIVDRILQIIEYKGISKSAFYRETGLSNGFLDKVKDVGSSKIEHILKIYPEISPNWLLTGNGNMLISEEVPVQLLNKDRKTKDVILEMQEVPLYSLEATAGLVDFFKSSKPTNTLNTIKIPNIPSCDGAISVTGDSMYPLLKSGDIILYKQVPVERINIYFGEMYLLGVRIDEYEEMITVKYVQKSDLGDDYIKLVSQNQHHQSKDIPLNSVSAMAMVKASIRYNTMW